MTRSTVAVSIDPVEDSTDDDAVEVLEHVELAVDRVERRWVLDAEVVGEQSHAIDAPLALRLGVAEQAFELVVASQLGPGLTEQVVEELRRALGGGVVEETLQGEMGGRAPRLIHRSRFAEAVDRPELE